MKKIIYFVTIALIIASCKKEVATPLNTPTAVSNVLVQPRIGGALLRWNVPADSNYTYLEVAYDRNGTKRIIPVSKYTDSLLVTGLLNKLDYTFTITSVNRDASQEVKGSPQTSPTIKSIRRPDEVTYFSDNLTKVTVPASALVAYTQEPTEGPIANLVDGNINTYWHSAWSSGVAPLPHWIQITMPAPVTIGLIKYWFRQNNTDVAGRPTQIGLETSDDGVTWIRVFTSANNLPTDNPTVGKTLSFGKNFTSRYFRVMILANGGKTYTHLGEMEFYTMAFATVDKEKEAEDNYLNPWL